ncbi:hypothetical protein NM688_g3344 [Phlebia brevispora]|uniref:Uncharacterized protein n=1 Tax=Phlebia brevispora TaxID=194682 RepID=A0ACC1T5V7_9APHY|nr:hypothetical protein NM688_g3344 [Phlebia brevispora]
MVIVTIFAALRVFALLERAYITAAVTFLFGMASIVLNVLPGFTFLRLLVSNIFPGRVVSDLWDICSTTLACASCTIVADIIAIVITWIKTYRQVREASAIGINVGFAATLLQYGTLYFVLPNVVLSRFIINLRQADFPESTRTTRFSHFSRFSPPNFRVPSLASFIGNLGEPLADDEESTDGEAHVEGCAFRDSAVAESRKDGGTLDNISFEVVEVRMPFVATSSYADVASQPQLQRVVKHRYALWIAQAFTSENRQPLPLDRRHNKFRSRAAACQTHFKPAGAFFALWRNALDDLDALTSSFYPSLSTVSTPPARRNLPTLGYWKRGQRRVLYMLCPATAVYRPSGDPMHAWSGRATSTSPYLCASPSLHDLNLNVVCLDDTDLLLRLRRPFDIGAFESQLMLQSLFRGIPPSFPGPLSATRHGKPIGTSYWHAVLYGDGRLFSHIQVTIFNPHESIRYLKNSFEHGSLAVGSADASSAMHAGSELIALFADIDVLLIRWPPLSQFPALRLYIASLPRVIRNLGEPRKYGEDGLYEEEYVDVDVSEDSSSADGSFVGDGRMFWSFSKEIEWHACLSPTRHDEIANL